jgi:FAD/FMN-containing dehydrogenase/Fe-S oxidoreductase
MNATLPKDLTADLTAPQQPLGFNYDAVARASNEVAAKLAQQLAAHTRGEVLFAQADRARYSTDASIYQVVPTGVFVPRSQDDVQMALAICRDLNVPIVARGGGTSQCGQTVGAGLVVDFSKYLRKVQALDVNHRLVTVEPGLVLDHLNASLKQHGLWYPVDVSTAAQATLGGMAGNNSCGSRSIAYGNMVHNVAAVEAWLADGTELLFGQFDQAQGRALQIGQQVQAMAHQLLPQIESNWPKVMRRVGGYNLDIFAPQSSRPYTQDGSVNLAHLLIGSEGTLALTRSLTLKLTDLPRNKVLGVVNFASFHRAMDSAQHIVQVGGRTLSAVELVDRTMIELSLQNPAFAPTVKTALAPAINGGKPEALLLVEFSGDDPAQLAQHLRDLSALMGDLGLPDCVVPLTDPAAQKNLWEVRKAGLNIMMSLRGDGKPVSFIEDCAVPLPNLAEYTDALTEVFRKHGSKGTWYAHASVGTLHVRPILDMRTDGAQKMRAIAQEASELVRRFKGAYSGEHGDGLCRGEWIQWQFGSEVTAAFAQIKRTLDPNHLLCPQRMIDPPKMDDQSLMRFSPAYKVISLKPALDWQSWNVKNDPVTETTTALGTGGDPAQGLAKAVEMCNNNGHCRQFDAGTMCPSYRVTRDERHVTRGRANTLRFALSGQLNTPTRSGNDAGQVALASDAVHEALELCVSCKACKRECPTGVDMAKMKVEHLHARQKLMGLRFKEKLVAYLPDYASLAAAVAPLLNLRNRLPVLANVMDLLLGISRKRSLPEWQRQHFFNQEKSPLLLDRKAIMTAANPVVLFVDTFNGFFENANAQAALQVLTAGGYSVHLASKMHGSGHLCCGRTLLASGLVDQAKVKAQELLTSLLPFAQAGIPIVGLEPSCTLTMRDEMLSFELGEQAQLLSQHVFLFEEFLAAQLKMGQLATLQSQLVPAKQTILLHGHCHQKAFDAVKPIVQVLQMIPQAKVQLIESSCCGMAGAFGYQSRYFDVSNAMAELTLLPAIREQPDALIVADGTSCRHQIKEGTARQAVHAAVALAAHLR